MAARCWPAAEQEAATLSAHNALLHLGRTFKLMKTTVLNENRDFRRVYGRGKSNVNPALVSYVTKGRAGFCRVGITAGKKIGTAVKRNRAKRIIREAFRALSPRITGSFDIVFVARAKTPYKKSGDILKIMEAQLKTLGVL